MEHIKDGLYWQDLKLGCQIITADHVACGEAVRFMMHEHMQMALLKQFFLCPLSTTGCMPDNIWLQRDGELWAPGTDVFCQRIGCMIRQRGLLANLSLKENLLLPFLYSDQQHVLKKAEEGMAEVADFLGLQDKLDEKAGERSAYIHALISLGHCLLKKPDIVIVKELYLGMQSEHIEAFQSKILQALKQLNAGVLYLTCSKQDMSELSFDRSYELKGDTDDPMEWQW